jgi:hypothetical protein
MPQPLQHRRGAVLPASLAEGEFFFKTDTAVWYSGPAGGGTPIPAGGGATISAQAWKQGVFTFTLDPNDAADAGWSVAGFDGSSLAGAVSVLGTGEWGLAGATSLVLQHSTSITGLEEGNATPVFGALTQGKVVFLYEPDGTPLPVGDGLITGIILYRTT